MPVRPARSAMRPSLRSHPFCRPRPRPRAFRRDERGASAVEFALVVPLLLMLVLGIIDFGRLLFVTQSLTAAVREGGRELATLPNLGDATRRAAVQARVVGAFQPMGGAAITGAQVVLSTAPDAGGNVTVRVAGYTYVPVTPIARLVGFGTITLSRQAVFRWERTA